MLSATISDLGSRLAVGLSAQFDSSPQSKLKILHSLYITAYMILYAVARLSKFFGARRI
jgi:hypothetical protein